MSETIDPLRKFYIVAEVVPEGIQHDSALALCDFPDREEAAAYAVEKPGRILGEFVPIAQAQHTLAPLTPKRQHRKRKPNGAGEPAQVEASPTHDPAEPPLPLDAKDSADIPPFLRR
jgi:hypothetical protein